jgi:hypothetical protein
MINPVDGDQLRRQVGSAKPFPHCVIDNFLGADFADLVLAAFPSYEDACQLGQKFRTVNERKKVQINNPALFPEAVAELNRLLSAPGFLDLLSHAFDIPRLVADRDLIGGGMHVTGPRGRLDVHVDFNFILERQLHRRLNILLYLNKNWSRHWGGNLELWDKEMTRCVHSFSPDFNRCVVFETSEISYHGVTAVKCPQQCARRSFAAYYYTKEPPPHWTGRPHGTIFRGRPDEVLRAHVLMPLENLQRRIGRGVDVTRGRLKHLLRPNGH